MSISSRTRKRDGRKIYDVRLRDPSGRMYSRTFETRREAVAFEAAQRADRARGQWLDPRRAETPFSQAARNWLAASAHKRPLSIERDRAIIDIHLRPILGGLALGSITPSEIQALVNDWNKISPPATVVRQYATLRAIFNHAVTTDLLGRSPCRGIRLPQVQPRESTLVTAKDLERLAEAMPDLEAMPYLGAVLGLRWAEIAGLRVGSLDFLRFTITITRQWTRGKGGAMVNQDPKSRAGRRVLTVPDWLMAMLTSHLAARGLTAADLDAFVFVGSEGKPLHYSNWRQRVWLPATKAAKLDGLHFHDLRHTAGTALVAGGVDVKTAQVRLGHASPLTTLRVYAQATQDADRAAAKSLGDLFRPGAHEPAESADATDSNDVTPDVTPDEMCDGCEIVPLATTGSEPRNPPEQDFPSGARWNRTTDLSIISAAL